ncbi:MAG: hypothetical protein QOE32_7371 [Pseudonocardiales bacterium]|nr:hypothetical protein [Pseudonocardiales bacterium]MDT7589821.1 hypothetical protein [Pseudonocardiales bacterium]MDT7749957.1 hypothetical protein [Pseudonocardiales bacterium]
MQGARTVGNVQVTVTGVADLCVGERLAPDVDGEALMSGPGRVPTQVADERYAREASSTAIPTQRSAADAYRVSEDQVHRARIVVARNADDSDDCRRLLDMLGLIASSPDQVPPVRR